MVRSLVIGLAVAVAILATPVSSQEDFDFSNCRITEEEIDCRPVGSAEEAKKDESFWTSPLAQTFYAIFGLAASGGAAFFGWTRVRKQRVTLRQMLRNVEETFAVGKTDPLAGIERLNGIRTELTTRHRHGKVDDGHYLELDRKVADYTARLRVIHFELRFPSLPLELMGEVRNLAQDGHLSKGDIARIEKRARTLRIPAQLRDEVVSYLHMWADADPVTQPMAAPPAPVYVKA